VRLAAKDTKRFFVQQPLRLSFYLSFLLLLSACATVPVEKAEAPYWPSLPDMPRFQYEFTLRSNLSLSGDNITNFEFLILGRGSLPKLTFTKPFDVAAYQGKIIVSDTAAGVVFLFSIPERKVLLFGRYGKGKLEKPLGVAIDGNANYYVADVEKRRVTVYKTNGHFKQYIGGPEDLERPTDVAVLEDGSRIFVVDAGGVKSAKHRIVAYDAKGNKLFIIGGRGNTAGMFNLPTHATVGPDGTLYVLDAGNFRIQAFDKDGNYLRKWGEVGTGFGQFARPRGIATDKDGNVYVTDTRFGNFQIFNSKGRLLMAVGEVSMEDRAGQYSLIAGVAVDETNRVYVVGQRFRKVEVIRRLSEEEGKSLMQGSGG
jgi:DNA-binding beta-propeller fold protein YncE